MFGFNSPVVSYYKRQLKDWRENCDHWYKSYIEQKRENINLKDENEALKATNEENIPPPVYDDTAEATFSVCFWTMNAVSIERVPVVPGCHPKVCTVIGYKKPDGQIADWTLYCDLDTHNALAVKFEEYARDKREVMMKSDDKE